MATNTIYIIHNTVNDKKYVGQTWTSLKRRWRSGYDNSIHLHRAMKKYGKKTFYYEVLALCSDQETADYLEAYYIDLYDTQNDRYGYNIRGGGENKFQHSPETIVRMSEAKTAKAKLKLEDILPIRKAFADGTPTAKLAEDYGVSRSTMNDVTAFRTWRRVPGIRVVKSSTKLSDDEVRQVKHLYSTGQKSAIEIGKQFGISRTTVYQLMSGARRPNVS